MKNPKCLTCKKRTELVVCHCQESQQVYFCWTCCQHYPLKTKSKDDEQARERGTFCWDCDKVFIDPKKDNYQYGNTGRIICLDCYHKDDKKTTVNTRVSKVRCDNCCKHISRKYLKATDQGHPETRNYCQECMSLVSKGIFYCNECMFQSNTKTPINTRNDQVKFFIDLNHNVFCVDCWEDN